jgi:glycosyltransferase involved in cell wall biosynthesis
MRILLVNYEYPPAGGGAATATQSIARELVRLGHAVVVLTAAARNLNGGTIEDGVVIRRVGWARQALDRSSIAEMFQFVSAAMFRATRIAREEAIDCAIVFFSLPCGPVGLVLRLFRGIPYVISLRGGDVPGTERSLGWLHWLLTPFRRAVLRSAAAIVANSQGLAGLATVADHVHVKVIPNGVDTDYFIPASTVQRSRRCLRILFVGRLRKQKNVSFLLEQLARMNPGDFQLHIVGDGPDREMLQGCAAKLRIDRTVTWHGWISRPLLRDIYHAADCVVNVSVYEGMSNVLLEAMACALPVIASNVPGNRDVVSDGLTGLLFDLREPRALIAALQRLRAEPLFATALGKKARDFVVERFSWKAVAAAYVDLLQNP